MKYFFTAATLLFFIACKTDKPVEPEPTADLSLLPPFQLHEGFKGENYSCATLYPTGNQLIVIGDNFVATLDTNHKVIRSTTFNAQRQADSWTKMHTNGTYFTYYSRNQYNSWREKIMVRSVAQPNLSVEIDIRKVDTNFRSITLAAELSAGLLIQDNRLLLPVLYSNDPQNWIIKGECRLVVFKIQATGNQLTATLDPLFYPLSITPSNLIPLGVSNLFQARPNDRFIYFSSYSTYQLDLQTGNHDPIFDFRSTQFGFRNDTLWAFGRNESRDFGLAFLPPNNPDWTIFTTNSTYSNQNWRFTGKHILPIYNQSHIAHFTAKLDSSKFSIQSLADNNIRGIRDLVAFKDRVYLATSQGLLWKPLSSLIVYPPK
jgi:hypothetical protein